MIDVAISSLEKPQLLKLIQELQSQNQKLQHQVNQLLRTVYGKKSEKFISANNAVQVNQAELGFEVESLPASDSKTETITYNRTVKTGNKNHIRGAAFPDHLERVDIIIEPLEDVTGMVKIGEEVSERLAAEPGKLFVKRYRRPKYAKPQGEGVVIGELPSFIIQKGMADASLLALIIIQKYCDHLPLYRQIEMFKRLGVEIPASTMSDWVITATRELIPLYELLKAKILSAGYLMADETPIKVLDQDPQKGNIHLGYHWVYRDPDSELVLFDYRRGRGREGPADILKNFEGYLQTDGYSVYENFDTDKITLFHCMAHARRKFDEALQNDRIRAEHVLLEMQKLYDVERHCRESNYTHQQRLELRQEKSLPVLTALHQWLKENMDAGTKKSAIRTAINYSLQRWEKLMIYASNGKLEIDNNLVENSIRPVALGKKNYLFAGSDNAAQVSAMIYSLLGTCKLKGVEPFQWLKKVFEVLPDWKFNRLEELLP